METGIIEVRATKKTNGTYMYTGIREDGSTVALRKTATRLYQNAYLYASAVASGSKGLAAYFLYGKNQPAAAYGQPVKTFRVILEQ